MVQLASLLFATAAFSVAAVAASPLSQRDIESTRAVYFQTNQSPNSIVATKVESGGTLVDPTFHSTGGVGSAELTPTGPHLPDPLGSANSVVVFGDYLFAVNAGSNQISLFVIPLLNPTDLILVGKFPVNGDFPNSIAVKADIICVSYTGARSGVSCAEWHPWGIDEFDPIRPLDLNQQNPPSTNFLLISDIFFAQEDSSLVVSTRGPSAATPGIVVIYPVDRDGQVSSKASDDSTPTGTIESFGGVSIPGSSLIFVAEATFGGYTLDLNHPQAPVHKFVVPGEQAICWAGITSNLETGILPDAGRNVFVQVGLSSGNILQQWSSTNGNAGNIDFAISADDTLFALAFNPADSRARVASINVGEKFADLDNIPIDGTNMFSQGLAIYPAV